MNDDSQMMDVSQTESAAIESIPRINGSMLGNYINSQVSIVGKFLGSNSDSGLMPFEAADGKNFNVKIDNQQPWDGYQTKYVEVRGVVQNDGSILQASYQEYKDGNKLKFISVAITIVAALRMLNRNRVNQIN